ncbi:phosphotransferase [Nocardia sp. NPDC004278]
MDTGHVDRLARVVELRQEAFDSVTTPRFLHDDLWTANVMVDESAADPLLTGVFDWDRECTRRRGQRPVRRRLAGPFLRA